MNFMERMDASMRATDRIIQILNSTFPEKSGEAFAGKIAILATVIGEAVEVLLKMETEENDADKSI